MRRISLFLLLACLTLPGWAGGSEWREKGGLYALFAEDGKQLTEYRYATVTEFHHGVSTVRLGKNIGLVNEQGKELVRPIYGNAPIYFGDSQFTLYRSSAKPIWISYVHHQNLSAAWIDSTGKMLVQGTKAAFYVGDIIPEVLWDY